MGMLNWEDFNSTKPISPVEPPKANEYPTAGATGLEKLEMGAARIQVDDKQAKRLKIAHKF